ncbi:MAG: SET domain-containing protein [Turneriella sp.]|nr:SET domain-containing protein [Turneriella sp.]
MDRRHEKASADKKRVACGAALEVRTTRFGKGVFARRAFSAHERVLEFRGRRYSRTQYLAKLNPHKCHFMQIGEDVFLGPSRTPDNFVNHCCRPNCGLIIQNGRAFLVALRAIFPGEEITFDYSTSMAEDHWEMDCACGVPECRGRIRDFRHLPVEVQNYYIQLAVVPDFVLRSISSEHLIDQIPMAIAR